MALSKQQKMMDLLSVKNQGRIQRLTEDILEIHLQSGDFSSTEPCFLKDEKNKEYVVLPQKALQQIIALVRKAHEDKLKVELERDIISLTPIDFDDAMSVVSAKLESLRSKDGSLPNINTTQFTKEIKKEYPNLFLDFHIY